MDTLTPEALDQAERQWAAARPDRYRMVVEVEGDRVEAGRFEVAVQEGRVVSLRRNGQVVLPDRGEDYSMDGLFRMLRQELGLAENPVVLGAPPGYSAYLMARFDPQTGRLIAYRRTVGGTDNTIDIRVLEYQILE